MITEHGYQNKQYKYLMYLCRYDGKVRWIYGTDYKELYKIGKSSIGTTGTFAIDYSTGCYNQYFHLTEKTTKADLKIWGLVA